MIDDEKGARKKVIWGSVMGPVLPGSLSRSDGGLTAKVIDGEGAEQVLRVTEDRLFRVIEEAAERGGPVTFQGHRHGSVADGTAYLEVRIVGPLELTGVVSDIIRSDEGGRPHVAFWMLRELPSSEGVTHRIGTGVTVFDADADALSGLREGDRVSLLARHGEDGLIATSPVSVLSAGEADGAAP
jgi:hypothetical protein